MYQSCTISYRDSLLDVVQSDVVENKGSREVAVAWVGKLDECRCVVDNTVDDRLATNSLVNSIGGNGDVEADLVNGESLKKPTNCFVS